MQVNRHWRAALWLLGAVAPWGCASTPEGSPPASSLPGTLAVESSGSADWVEYGATGVEVPPANPPFEGQLAPAQPDPDDGAGTMLIYTAITGHQPFGESSARAAPSEPGRWTAAGEASRARSLEAQIEEELRRQRAAIDGIEADGSGQSTIESLITGQALAERANPRVAPDAPKDRELPLSVFELEPVTILSGSWDNPEPLKVTRGVLDADRDGTPEQIRFFDPETMVLLRKEQDSNFDGALDTWNTYEEGNLSVRVRDTDDDANHRSQSRRRS
jgi:hypothetical protein